MKSLLGFFCIVAVVICACAVYDASDTLRRAREWEATTASSKAVKERHREVARAQAYSQRLFGAVNMLASENGLLCEREAAMVKTLAAYEEENHRLKVSLTKACSLLEKSQKEIDALKREIERLKYKIDVLERALPDPAPTTKALKSVLKTTKETKLMENLLITILL